MSLNITPQRYVLQLAIASILLCYIGYALWHFPVYQVALALGLAGYLALLLKFPSSWLVVLPVLVPILDLTPVSGRVFHNAFDLFLLATVCAALTRREAMFQTLKLGLEGWLLLGLLVLWQSYTTLLGLMPLAPLDANSFVSYYSEFNALRIAKGFFGALLLLPMLGQLQSRGDSVLRWLVPGMVASLAVAIVVVLWERWLFTGLWNFATPYRVTGLFSIMATGGAPIDAHLIATLPFLYFLFASGKRSLQVTAILLLLGGLYSVAVTFSRANYPALLCSALVLAGLWWSQNRAGRPLRDLRKRAGWAAVLVFTGLVLLPVFSGDYIRERFQTVQHDLSTRFDHWAGATDLVDDGLSATLFGMGKGSFPRTYFWQRPDGQMQSTASHAVEDQNGFLTLGKSHSQGELYVRQRFSVTEPGPYRLSIALRPHADQKTRLLIEFCERVIFQAYKECRWRGINTAPDSSQWQTYNTPFSVDELGVGNWLSARPVEISILNRGLKAGIDIDNVQIITPSGRELLRNSRFEQGLDNWFLYSGDHLAWHVKNIWFDAYFEGGVVGATILVFLMLVLAVVLTKRTKSGDRLAPVLAAAFSGLMVVGMFDTLFDDPKIGLLFYLLVIVALCRATETAQSSSTTV